MTIAKFQMPDGRIARFEVPDGTTPEQAAALIEQSLAAAPVGREPQGAAPAKVSPSSGFSRVLRPLELTGRAAVAGAADAAQIGTEPIRNALLNLSSSVNSATPERFKAAGSSQPNMAPLSQSVTGFLDRAGLAAPETPLERVVDSSSRLVAGAGAMGAAGRVAKAAPGMPGAIGQFLSSNMPQQLSSAAGAGLLGGASKEAGDSPLAQFLSSLLGGVAGGLTQRGLSSVADAGRAVVNSMTPKELDAKISLIFRQAGRDYSEVPESVRQTLRSELASSLKAEREIDPAAVSRLADFKTVGAIPTRGMVSQNPVQITREMNLAKLGANSSDQGLQGLAELQNKNNSTLIQRLNQAGASTGDLFRAGDAAATAIRGRDAALREQVSGLYQQARNLPGGNTPLDRTKLVNGVFDSLARENKLAYLPEDISNTLNSISQGQITRNGQTFQVPFDAKALDNILTDIATAQRGTRDGNVSAALRMARDAINRMPIEPVKNTFGGNQVVTEAGARFLRDQDAQAGQFMDALNSARRAAASRFAWQESSRPVESVINGMQPDKFVQRFVIGGTVNDAQAVAQNAPVSEVKNAILAHLKDKALNGAADEVGKFSQSAYNKALKDIGERKLSIFFDSSEIDQLKTVGRVASYMQNQPVGSAVNNSNSGALLLGRSYDLLKQLAGKVPGGQALVLDPLQNIEVGLSTSRAMKPGASLLIPQKKPRILESMLLPAGAAGGLLTGE